MQFSPIALCNILTRHRDLDLGILGAIVLCHWSDVEDGVNHASAKIFKVRGQVQAMERSLHREVWNDDGRGAWLG